MSNTVYLFFSVNRSGQYCGLARMVSGILPQEETPPESPKGDTSPDGSQEESGLRIFKTAATENAPKGRVVDDVAHEVVFWEAELDAASRIVSSDSSNRPLIVSSTMNSNDDDS